MAFCVSFLAACILIINCCALLTRGNIIPAPGSSNRPEQNNIGASILIRLREASVASSPTDEGLQAAGETDTPTMNEADEGSIGLLPGHKRSVPTDSNLSDAPAAFAVAHDLSGAELAQILQGLTDNSDGLTVSGVPAGIRCSGVNLTNGGSASTYSPYASQVCPDDVIAVTNNDVPNRGLCPWTFVENIDENRYPSSIMYAQCACPSCIREDEQGFSTSEEGCHPIYYDVKVLRKHTCQGGIQIYDSGYERVPVACACLRPKREVAV